MTHDKVIMNFFTTTQKINKNTNQLFENQMIVKYICDVIMLMFITDEYFEQLILMILFFFVVLMLSFLFKISLLVMSKILFSNCQKYKHLFFCSD